MPIHVSCFLCARDFPSTSMRGRLCLDCAVDKACADLRAEFGRLTRKRDAYRVRGHGTRSTDEQLGRIRRRLELAVANVTLDHLDLQLQRQLKLALEQAYLPRFAIA